MRWSAAVLAVLLPLLASGQEPDADASAKLAKDGLVVLDFPLKEGFSAYIGSRHPNFITSDSLLMAYHRLFEELASRQSIAEMGALLRFWPALWGALPSEAPVGEAHRIEAHRRTRLLVATAYRALFGKIPAGLSAEEIGAVEAEASRIEKAEGDSPPVWLQAAGENPPYIPYHAFAPGPWTQGDEIFKRHYRCRKWLQEMPLDSSENVCRAMLEQIAVTVIEMDRKYSEAVMQPPFRTDPGHGLLEALGGDDWNYTGPDFPEERRADLRRFLAGPRHWTMLTAAVPLGSEVSRKLLESDRVSRTPDVIGAAVGNRVAESLLDESLRKLKSLERYPSEADSFYFGALRELNQETDLRAPEIMRSEAWRRKQLNATLGSWTEYRYATQLANREDALFMGVSAEEPGFVEPVPKFYHALGLELEDLAMKYSAGGASTEAATHTLVIRLSMWASLLKKAGTSPDGNVDPGSAIWRIVTVQGELLNGLFPEVHPEEDFQMGWHEEPPERLHELARLIEGLVAAYWSGEKAAAGRIREALSREPDELGPNLWRLASICFRLEAIAERQLSGMRWEGDGFFIEHFGKTLAELMFYKGNSCLSPPDEAPRIVRYATLGTPGGARVFHAATARPRLLLIRYSDRSGKETLCQGAVYAFRNVEKDRTPGREEWFAEAEKHPWPDWMAPIVGGVKDPKGK